MSTDSQDADPRNTNAPNDNPYDIDQMRYMSDLEHVRERSGMYIGNRDAAGLHHLVSEVVDNSIDEVMAGHATVVQVTVNPDGSITVADDGRGIPVDIDPNIGKSALEGVMTMLKYGGKFDNKAYKTSAGLHGIGVKAVNFLSEWCEVEVRRGGHAYQQEYERGKPTGPVIRVGTAQGTGTKTTFKPDYQMFGDLKFDYNIAVQAASGTGIPQSRREDRLQGPPQRPRRDVPIQRRHRGVHPLPQSGQRGHSPRRGLHQLPQ